MNWDQIIVRADQGNPTPPFRVDKSPDEWKALLSIDEYGVTRLSGTERPFSGEFCQAYEIGIYRCICCKTDLFNSETKFDSGTGWPSFTEPLEDNLVSYFNDDSRGYRRIEIQCNVCDAHLGHVFPDGPEPSGLRFCVNSLSLEKNED